MKTEFTKEEAEAVIETIINTQEMLIQATAEERKAFQDMLEIAIMKDPREPDEMDKMKLYFDLLNERFPAPKH